jgi:uncharacterized protein
LVLLFTLGAYSLPTRAAEVIPPSPSPHFIVDEAHVLSSSTVGDIEKQLEDFEQKTSNQIVVAIYPKIQTDDDIAAYSVRIFQAWKIGTKAHDNGVLLLVSVQDHRLTIQVGYGLEGALPDATAKTIIDQDITPRFKSGDYNGGIRAGVNSIMAATKGEYKASSNNAGAAAIFAFIVIVFVIITVIRFGTLYSASGGSFWWTLLLMFLNSSGNSRSSGGYGGGGFSGGGGFFGGGGRSGGGGASGSW